MQGALQTSPVSIHQPRAKRHNHEAQSLIPFVLFALPDEASRLVTLGEIITLLNRLDGYVGRQIHAQFCIIQQHYKASFSSCKQKVW